MTDPLVERIRQHAQALEPVPTGESPRLQPLEGIRAVAFDVYGTLIISGSGDVGTDQTQSRGAAFREAFIAAGLSFEGDADSAAATLRRTIETHQQRRRDAGIEYPEIDIIDVWRETLDEFKVEVADEELLQAVAVEFECRTNPTWIMPGAAKVLKQLQESEMTLGIISNAQFYTPLVLEALFGVPPERLGFAPDLQVYSYRYGHAKPGTFLYDRSAAAFAERGTAPREVLYVGNDLLKDVMPAARVGLRTALFAGDARSLRKRVGDERVREVSPDLVVTELSQILDVL